MKKLLVGVCVVVLLLMTLSANAKQSSVQSWGYFFENIWFLKANGDWDFKTKGNRSISGDILVNVPAGTMQIKDFTPCVLCGELNTFVAVLDPLIKVDIWDHAAQANSRYAEVHIVFLCNAEKTPLVCRNDLQSLLSRGVLVKSLGIDGFDYKRSGVIPDNIVFSFDLDARK